MLRLLAIVAALGCVSLVVGTLIAQNVVPGHDPIADTISDLGAGRYEIIMDVALYGFAAGLLAVALASAHAHLGDTGWSAGVLSFAVLAALVVVIGARNEYGDKDSEGVVIHVYLVWGLGLFFTVAPFCMASSAGAFISWTKPALIGLGALWLAAAPVFFFLPTGIDGLYERALCGIAVAQVLVFAWLFWQRAGATARV